MLGWKGYLSTKKRPDAVTQYRSALGRIHRDENRHTNHHEAAVDR